MAQLNPTPTRFSRTPDRSTKSIRSHRWQTYLAITLAVAFWLLGLLVDRAFGSGFMMRSLCAIPALLALSVTLLGWRNRLHETLEIHSEGVTLKNSWRLKTFYAWREVDTHRDQAGELSAENPLIPNGIGLLEPLYPIYLREHNWADPAKIAVAALNAQLTHYLPQLISQINASETIWFGNFGVSQQGIQRKASAEYDAATIYWHVIENLSAKPPLLDWSVVKFGGPAQRRSRRIQNPYKISLLITYDNPAFNQIEIFHQTLLFLHLLEAINHPVHILDT